MNLRERLQPYLKKAYFNARTDVVAERNHVVPPGGHHVAPAIDNMTQELAATIAADLKGIVGEDLDDFQEGDNEWQDGVNAYKAELRAALDRFCGVEGK